MFPLIFRNLSICVYDELLGTQRPPELLLRYPQFQADRLEDSRSVVGEVAAFITITLSNAQNILRLSTFKSATAHCKSQICS